MQEREHVFLISDADTEEPLPSFYVAVTKTLSALIFPFRCSSAAVPSYRLSGWFKMAGRRFRCRNILWIWCFCLPYLLAYLWMRNSVTGYVKSVEGFVQVVFSTSAIF